jgi:hypothetical protein
VSITTPYITSWWAFLYGWLFAKFTFAPFDFISAWSCLGCHRVTLSRRSPFRFVNAKCVAPRTGAGITTKTLLSVLSRKFDFKIKLHSRTNKSRIMICPLSLSLSFSWQEQSESHDFSASGLGARGRRAHYCSTPEQRALLMDRHNRKGIENCHNTEGKKGHIQ